MFSILYRLFNLYNLLETPYSQFYVYMKALNLAINGKVTDYIIPSFKKMDSFLKDWNIGIVDQRELFLTISNILKENKRYSWDIFHFKLLIQIGIGSYIFGFIPLVPFFLLENRSSYLSLPPPFSF